MAEECSVQEAAGAGRVREQDCDGVGAEQLGRERGDELRAPALVVDTGQDADRVEQAPDPGFGLGATRRRQRECLADEHEHRQREHQRRVEPHVEREPVGDDKRECSRGRGRACRSRPLGDPDEDEGEREHREVGLGNAARQHTAAREQRESEERDDELRPGRILRPWNEQRHDAEQRGGTGDPAERRRRPQAGDQELGREREQTTHQEADRGDAGSEILGVDISQEEAKVTRNATGSAPQSRPNRRQVRPSPRPRGALRLYRHDRERP